MILVNKLCDDRDGPKACVKLGCVGDKVRYVSHG